MPDSITIGARYRRTGEGRPIYVVVRKVAFDRHPPHVTLVSENQDRRSITIGAGVLIDRRQWVRLEPRHDGHDDYQK